jgi:hypothetical protein
MAGIACSLSAFSSFTLVVVRRGLGEAPCYRSQEGHHRFRTGPTDSGWFWITDYQLPITARRMGPALVGVGGGDNVVK